MTDTLTLLDMDNAVAQRTMIQEALIPGVSVDDLALGAHHAQGQDMLARVYVPAETAENENWPYQGEVDFRFHRIDLADFFQGIPLQFVLPFPTTASAIAVKLAEIFQVRFELSDHVDEAIDTDTPYVDYYFRAAAASQRWYGGVNVRLYRQPPAE